MITGGPARLPPAGPHNLIQLYPAAGTITLNGTWTPTPTIIGSDGLGLVTWPPMPISGLIDYFPFLAAVPPDYVPSFELLHTGPVVINIQRLCGTVLPRTGAQNIGVSTSAIGITLPSAAAIDIPSLGALNGDVTYIGGLSLVYDTAQSDWSQIRFKIVYGATASVSNIKRGSLVMVPQPRVGGCDSAVDHAFNPMVGYTTIPMIGGYVLPENVPQWPGFFTQGPV